MEKAGLYKVEIKDMQLRLFCWTEKQNKTKQKD